MRQTTARLAGLTANGLDRQRWTSFVYSVVLLPAGCWRLGLHNLSLILGIPGRFQLRESSFRKYSSQCHLDSLWIFRHWQDPLQLKPVTHMRHFRNQQQENIVAEYHTVATIAKPRNLHISYFYVVFVCTSQLRRKILVCMIIWHNPVAACIKLSSSTIKEFYVTVAWNKIETPSGNTIIDLRKYSWSDTFQLVTLRLTPAFHWPCNENTWLTDNSAHSNRA